MKRAIMGMTGFVFLSSFYKVIDQKNDLPDTSKKSTSQAYGANMAFGHSLSHVEFNQKFNIIS